ncbi:PREDICTED: B3 domain-containing protein Os07g0563300-like isoform X2 [Populus euphratica]|uniref:B3 domain-containing protein Os07g0563300-like isoform X1 n=1 Tax=Populus euphratica TaxID=75702 RepID=A0AAJ6X0R9_POPEU|nr:PREDICTED: B3 domain-containing protein Os07g0563300-like isoform X1 [Populus euphratica]XP_011001125.1 PREDICTED: B3 domain-containing protein Os07g0563300-like isoform X2 [Populus euphratica]
MSSSPSHLPTSTTATTANNNNTSCSSSSKALSRKCFNSDCTDFKSRKGWRLRSGDFAELCDRCASAYEEGSFCETFHLRASGWRCCESCGKRVHCGCIVSIQAFTFLDAGGIACMACERKSFVLTSNPAWSSLFYHAPFPERLKDLSVKSWSQLAGSGPVPWRQAPSLFNPSAAQSELQTRMPYEVDRLNTSERFSAPSLEKRKVEDFSEKFINGNLRIRLQDIVENGNAGIIGEEQPQPSSSLMEDASGQQFGITIPYKSISESNGQIEGSVNALQPAPPPPFTKHFHGSLHNGVDSSVDGHIRNGKPRTDARGRSQLLPRYWPRFTDGELQQISGNSNSVIKPLFEKMLSASDAGRIGRLVLPKKCAEAYFPPISQPEGLPLRVQDSKGKEWIFQFRFWPNNNSRMYVLEGVTPCIQNMQLQAGDIVTFSRLEPEGKLVMGFRKATSAPPSDQDNETSQTGNGVSIKGDAELDPSPWSKVDKSGYIAKEVLEGKSSIRKRKSSTLGSKSKRLRIENEDMIELKLTWEEAQGLLRPPPDQVPSIVAIEGFEFEEYEDAPVLGKPTIFASDNVGQKIQWVQCEDCLKWRKLPANALLPSKWACSSNTWDPERSSCSVAQELTAEQLEDLLPSCNLAVVTSKRLKDAKKDIDRVEALEGLDTLANLAILGEGEAFPASSQATTKHPRHRPGCSCIVCIQPPSGKGPKHKQTCTCNVCQTVKRRFKTLMMKREKKQSEKEAETKQSEKEAETTRKTQQEPAGEKLLDDEPSPSSNTGSESGSPNKKKTVSEGSDDDPNRMKSSTSPFKGQIDLNIQPEREDELSPGSDSGGMMRMLQDATETYIRMQRFLSSDGDNNPSGNHMLSSGGTREKVSDVIMLGSNHQDADKDHPSAFSMNASASTPATG